MNGERRSEKAQVYWGQSSDVLVLSAVRVTLVILTDRTPVMLVLPELGPGFLKMEVLYDTSDEPVFLQDMTVGKNLELPRFFVIEDSPTR